MVRLALGSGRAVSPELLVAALWDGEPPASADVSVRVLLSRVRKASGRRRRRRHHQDSAARLRPVGRRDRRCPVRGAVRAGPRRAGRRPARPGGRDVDAGAGPVARGHAGRGRQRVPPSGGGTPTPDPLGGSGGPHRGRSGVRTTRGRARRAGGAVQNPPATGRAVGAVDHRAVPVFSAGRRVGRLSGAEGGARGGIGHRSQPPTTTTGGRGPGPGSDAGGSRVTAVLGRANPGAAAGAARHRRACSPGGQRTGAAGGAGRVDRCLRGWRIRGAAGVRRGGDR